MAVKIVSVLRGDTQLWFVICVCKEVSTHRVHDYSQWLRKLVPRDLTAWLLLVPSIPRFAPANLVSTSADTFMTTHTQRRTPASFSPAWTDVQITHAYYVFIVSTVSADEYFACLGSQAKPRQRCI